MRHDLNYRRVLRTQEEYLFKYKNICYFIAFAFIGIIIYNNIIKYIIAKKLWDDRTAKSKNKKLKNELQKLREKENEKDLSTIY
jgi:hypothetical protein